jgi:hypothetical protein
MSSLLAAPDNILASTWAWADHDSPADAPAVSAPEAEARASTVALPVAADSNEASAAGLSPAVSEALAADKIDALTAAIDDRLSDAIAALEKEPAESQAAVQLSEVAAVSARLTVDAPELVVKPLQSDQAEAITPSFCRALNS